MRVNRFDLWGMLTNPRIMRLAAFPTLSAVALATGCAHSWGTHRVSKLDANNVVLTELFESEHQSDRRASVAAPGPSLVAGDDIAMEWAGVYLESNHLLALEYLE